MARMISDNFNNIYNAEQKKPLIFYSSPGQLQDLASVSIATYLWSFYQKKFVRRNGFPTNYVGSEEVCNELQNAYLTQLPAVILKKIDECVHRLNRNLMEWCKCHNGGIDEYDLPVFDVFHLISWNPCGDGSINYGRTARNLVKSAELNVKQKYAVACINCFVEDIKRLVSGKHDNPHPLVRYWNCRMEGKEYDVTDVYRNVDVDDYAIPRSSVAASILWHHLAAEWITMPDAFKYFWKYLTSDEQVMIIVGKNNIVEIFSIREFREHVLCTLDEQQLQSVIELSHGRIFVMLYNQSETHAVLLWNHIENMISVAGFYFIIRAFLIDDAHGTAFKFWLNASDSLRNDVLIQYKETLLEHMCNFKMNYNNLICNFRCDASLMIEFLTADPSYPKEAFWRKNWKQIIVGTPLQQLHLIMKLCLGSDDEVASFKKMHMCEYSEIGNNLIMMVSVDSFEELSEFLRFIAEDDPKIIFGLRICILKSTDFFKLYFEVLRFDVTHPWFIRCDQFIEDTFPDSDHLKTFRKNFVISEATFECFRHYAVIWHIDIGVIQKLCDHFLSSMPDVLTEVKNRLLELGREVLISAEFCRFSSTVLETFVKWCLNSDKYLSIKLFKDTLPLDIIFDKLIHNSVLEMKPYTDWELSNCMNTPSLEMLQSFLHWFFEFSDEVLDFKLSKLNAGENTIKEIRLLQKSNGELKVNILMKWFFLEQDGEFYTDNFEASLFDCTRSVE